MDRPKWTTLTLHDIASPHWEVLSNIRFRAKRDQLERCEALLLESQGQNLALLLESQGQNLTVTVFYVPYRGTSLIRNRPPPPRTTIGA